MKAVLFSAVACLATAVSAQATSACAADYILETCLSGATAMVSACNTQDYSCLCTAYTNLLVCFNNCPNDTRLSSYQGTTQIYCGYVSQFASTSTTKTTTNSGATAAVTTTTATGTGATTSGTSTGTATSSASTSGSTAKTNNAVADLALNAGSVLMAVAGAAAALL